LSEHSGAKREMGLFHTIMVGLNGALGINIFILLDHAITLAGPSILLSILLCGALTFFIMLSYCELGTLIPEVGGEYTFAKVAFGGPVAFMTGWVIIVGTGFGAALASLGFAYFINYYIPIDVHLAAAAIIVLVAVTSIFKLRRMEVFIVFAFIAIFAIFIVLGIIQDVKPDLSFTMPNGIFGTLSATVFLYNLFFGVRAIIASGSEVKNPEKNIPRAIFISIAILTAIYFAITYIIIAVAPLGSDVPGSLLTYTAEFLMGDLGRLVITFAGLFASLMSLTTFILIQTSVITALGRDRYLPSFFLSRHKRFGTHHISIVMGSLLTLVFVVTGVVEIIGYASSFMALLAFIAVNLSLMKMRTENPHAKRPFKVLFYPYVPIAGIILAIISILFAERISVIIGLVLLSIGLVAYYFRMIGYLRFRIAIGGMNVGIGLLIIASVTLFRDKIVEFIKVVGPTDILINFLYLIGAVTVIAGMMNIAAKE